MAIVICIHCIYSCISTTAVWNSWIVHVNVVVSPIIPHAIKYSDVVNITAVLTSDVTVAIKSNLMLLERLSFSC